MSEPTVAERTPVVLELDVGTYWWCKCGLSQDQPFCDGAHVGTDFEPMEFEVVEKKRYALCRCKYTERPPFCDGAHKRLPE